MTDKENSAAGQEIPIVPPDEVVAFGDPEPPDDGEGDPEPPDKPTPPSTLGGALGDPEPPDDGSGS